MKKKLILALVMVISLSVVTGCGCGKKKDSKDTAKKDEVKVNTEKEVVKDREFDGLNFTNTSLTTTNGTSTLVTVVTNPSSEDYELDEFRIIVKDKDGKQVANIPGYVGGTIPAGESRTIDSSTDIDLSEAKSIEYEVKK